MTTITESVKISALNEGDIVQHFGMRILLDRAPIEFDLDGMYGPARSFNGRVLNPSEVDDQFIAHMMYLDHATGERADTPRWTVQSNDLMRWARECESTFDTGERVAVVERTSVEDAHVGVEATGTVVAIKSTARGAQYIVDIDGATGLAAHGVGFYEDALRSLEPLSATERR